MTALMIVIWNVAHGSAIYAKTPNGRHILMDAGRSSTFSPAQHLKVNHLSRDQRIDALYVSHSDEDHVRDIENVGRLLSPKVFIRNPSVPKDVAYISYPPLDGPLKYYHEFDQRYSFPIESGSWNDTRVAQHWGGLTQQYFWSSAEQQFTCNNDYSL